MADFQQRNDSGILFRNDRKEEGSKQPDYNGNCMVNGKAMDMAAWVKVGKNGNKFMSFQFKAPTAVFDDDCPF